MTGKHQRSRTRVSYTAHALVHADAHGTIGGTVRDIAIDTVYINIVPVFELDEQVKLEIILLGADSQLSIKVAAKVVRKDDEGVAMAFLNPLEWWPVFTFFPMHSLDKQGPPA